MTVLDPTPETIALQIAHANKPEDKKTGYVHPSNPPVLTAVALSLLATVAVCVSVGLGLI